MRADPRIPDRLEFEQFEYNTRLVGSRLLTRVPSYRTAADKLRTRYERISPGYDEIVVITHSQGGLVLQTFLSRMLSDGQGEKLAPIKRIVMTACPNGGSGIFLLPRRVMGGFLLNVQEKRLRPLDEEVADTHRHVVKGIAEATQVTTASCPIPIVSFAAESDRIVQRASAYGSFRLHGILPGSHNNVHKPRSLDDPGYLDLSNEVLRGFANGVAASRTPPAGGPGTAPATAAPPTIP
ncbi:hypothetical protein E1264_38910, partial [Actinomadura sp. KC216]